MFFKNRRSKLSIDEQDKVLIDNAFESIEALFGSKILERQVILPTKEFFPIDFHGEEDNATDVFDRLSSFMDVDNSKIDLVFYSERRDLEFSSGLISIPDESEELTAGRYVEYDDGGIEIFIEEQELKNPVSLIATLSHELAHFKLRQEVNFKEEDEILTDILTIAHGLGIFTANTSIVRMNTWADGNYSGWQVKGGSGYLHYKVCGYALALYSYKRGEDLSANWAKYLEKDVRKEYEKSFKYLSSRDIES